MKEIFNAGCEMGLYTRKLHLLDPVVGDQNVPESGIVAQLRVSTINVHTNRRYRSKLQQHDSTLEESVRVVNATGQEIREELVPLRNEKQPSMVEQRDPIGRTRSFLV